MRWGDMGTIERVVMIVGVGSLCLFLFQITFAGARMAAPVIFSLAEHLPPAQAISAAVIGGGVAAAMKWWWS